jgi:hypothetical protein
MEKFDRQRQCPVGFRLAVGLAAQPGKGVVRAGIFVNLDQWIWRIISCQ